MIIQSSNIIKKKFDKIYKLTIDTINSCNLQDLLDKINTFFNYLWRSNLGINENEILSKFPKTIKIDIMRSFYRIKISPELFFYTVRWRNS